MKKYSQGNTDTSVSLKNTLSVAVYLLHFTCSSSHRLSTSA